MKRIFLLFFSLISSCALFAQFTVEGGIGGRPIEYKTDLGGTGLNAVYLYYTFANASFSFESEASTVEIYYYNQINGQQPLPAGDITTSVTGGVTTYTVSNLVDGRGYVVNQDNRFSALWLIDYSVHRPVLTSIEPIRNDLSCENLKLKIDKTDGLEFFGVSGNKRVISQAYLLTYSTMEWDDNQKKFVEVSKTIERSDFGVEVSIDPPLKNTQFRFAGDQFASHFGMNNLVESQLYEALAVEPRILAKQEDRESDNDTGVVGENLLGGSAPVRIKFSGYSNNPNSDYYTWFICKANDVKNPIARYTDRNIDYEFNQSGDFKVYLEVANANSSCIKMDSVSFSVGTSMLEAPNFFSPDASPGVNDEFRVAYKSIVKFKCTIFNRYGTKLYQWTDPAKGWDGRVGGRLVNTGVYYYVIEATGADGKPYKMGGGINVLRKR